MQIKGTQQETQKGPRSRLFMVTHVPWTDKNDNR